MFRGLRRVALFAVISAVAACSEEASPPVDVLLPAPPFGRGFQLGVAPFDVGQGEEIQRCHYMRVPGEPGTVHYVNRFEMAMNPGSHHMNLFRVAESYVTAEGLTDGQVVDCFGPLPLDHDTMWLIANNQVEADDIDSGRVDWQLPEGVVLELHAGDMLNLQTHYVNATTQRTPLHGKVLVNLYTVPEARAQHRMCSMFANNRSIRLPPREPYSATTTCRVAEDIHLVGLSGHFHSRGERFDIRRYEEGAPLGSGELLYSNVTWDEAPFRTWSNIAETPLIPARGGLEYTCEFFNNTDSEIVFGPRVEINEHCNLFAYYYPCPADGVIYCF